MIISDSNTNNPSNDFVSLGLKLALYENLKSMNYHQMTQIQSSSLPAILAGKDVLGKAKTGSGKTAAFGLGLLQNLHVKRFVTDKLTF